MLETNVLAAADKARLLELGGRGTVLATKRPHGPRFIACDSLNASLRWLRVEVLDVVDVVVSKLKQYGASDRADVDAMLTVTSVAFSTGSSSSVFEARSSSSRWMRGRTSYQRTFVV